MAQCVHRFISRALVGQRFVHLLNYTGDKRMSGSPRLQDVSVIQGIQVRCKCAAKPRSVLLVPEHIPLPFDWKDGWASFQSEPLAVHSVYMMEGY